MVSIRLLLTLGTRTQECLAYMSDFDESLYLGLTRKTHNFRWSCSPYSPIILANATVDFLLNIGPSLICERFHKRTIRYKRLYEHRSNITLPFFKKTLITVLESSTQCREFYACNKSREYEIDSLKYFLKSCKLFLSHLFNHTFQRHLSWAFIYTLSHIRHIEILQIP